MKTSYVAQIIEPTWASISLKGLTMEKLNLDFFYHLGARLNELCRTIIDIEPDELYGIRLLVLQRTAKVSPGLNVLLEGLSALNVCRGAADELLKSIDAIEEWANNADKDAFTKPDSYVDSLCTARHEIKPSLRE